MEFCITVLLNAYRVPKAFLVSVYIGYPLGGTANLSHASNRTCCILYTGHMHLWPGSCNRDMR